MNTNRLDEETALSIIFANTKRKKRSVDILTIAKSFEYLVRLYGSQEAVAKKVGLSTEMVREFLLALKLPKEVQRLISTRKIDSIDTVREISIIKDPAKQVEAAKALANSPSKDVRDIKRLVKAANVSVEDAKKIVSNAKPKGLHIFIVDFDDETYQAIIKHAKAMKLKPAELVRDIVSDWLNKAGKRKK